MSWPFRPVLVNDEKIEIHIADGEVVNSAVRRAQQRFVERGQAKVVTVTRNPQTLSPQVSESQFDTKPDHVLLRAFHETREPNLREFLFLRWRKRAVSAAKRYFNYHMPYQPLLALDDLESAALIGLLKAIDNFDPDKNDNFLGWMQVNIRWAIIDELRHLQDFPRVIARNRRILKKQLAELTQVIHHKPTLEDIRTYLGEDAFKIASDPLFFSNVFNQGLSNTNSQSYNNNGFVLADVILDDSGDLPCMTLREDLEKIVLDVLDGYHRSIIYRYYFMQMIIPDIAMTLHISTTSVSEKMQEALSILKRHLLEQ